MATMNLKKSTIFMLAKEDCIERECWGCNEVKLTKFRDTSTSGYLCKECMPDAYWAGTVLANTDGIRDPRPGECKESDNT